MKTVKAKNIANSRSKSVDFRFFEEIKENYLFKRNQKGSGENAENNLVFGQTLYKCILNDLSHSTNKSNAAKNLSSSNLGKNKSRMNTSIGNPNKVLIASKFDMDVLNVISKNPNVVSGGSTRIIAHARPHLNNIENLNNELIVNKRNSVLFEALDLKNALNNASNTNGHVSKASKFLNFKSSHQNQQMASINEEKSNEITPAVINNNQNFSIRSEGLVPNIVKSCCRHISEHGLDLVGIFRIESSKKRIKEMKEMFDCGKPIVLDETCSSNDVACILKEYLRSLQEPLLTRDLYSSFLATTSN